MSIVMITGARWRRVLLALSLLLPALALADTLSEDSVKAGFVLNFTKFVDWSATGVGGNELVICSLSPQSLSGKLDQLQGRTVQGRTIQVQSAVRPSEMRECQVFFIPADDQQRVEAILQQIGQKPVLTISDAPNFIQAGGIIGLKLRDGQIRFGINLKAARKAGLILGSQLLRLAEEVQQ